MSMHRQQRLPQVMTVEVQRDRKQREDGERDNRSFIHD